MKKATYSADEIAKMKKGELNDLGERLYSAQEVMEVADMDGTWVIDNLEIADLEYSAKLLRTDNFYFIDIKKKRITLLAVKA